MKKQTMHCLVSVLAMLMLFARGAAFEQQTEILLWPNGAPGSEGKTGNDSVRITPDGEHVVSNVHRPSLTPYLPAKGKSSGAAVIVVPGGGIVSSGWITKVTMSQSG